MIVAKSLGFRGGGELVLNGYRVSAREKGKVLMVVMVANNESVLNALNVLNDTEL